MERNPTLLKIEQVQTIESENMFINIYEEIYDDYEENKIVVDIQPDNIQLRQGFKEVERTPKYHKYLLTEIINIEDIRSKLYLIISKKPESLIPGDYPLLYAWFELHHPRIRFYNNNAEYNFAPFPFIVYKKERDFLFLEKEVVNIIKHTQDSEIPGEFYIHMACTIESTYGLDIL